MAKIQMIVRDDEDNIVDSPTIIIPPGGLNMMLAAFADTYVNSYSKANPDFDDQLPVSEENPETITESYTPVRHMIFQIRKFGEIIVKAYAIKEAEKAAKEAAEAQAAALLGAIQVQDSE